jgi:hypothetical protein
VRPQVEQRFELVAHLLDVDALEGVSESPVELEHVLRDESHDTSVRGRARAPRRRHEQRSDRDVSRGVQKTDFPREHRTGLVRRNPQEQLVALHGCAHPLVVACRRPARMNVVEDLFSGPPFVPLEVPGPPDDVNHADPVYAARVGWKEAAEFYRIRASVRVLEARPNTAASAHAALHFGLQASNASTLIAVQYTAPPA